MTRSMGLILSTILPGLLRDLAGLCGVGFVSCGAWLVYPVRSKNRNGREISELGGVG